MRPAGEFHRSPRSEGGTEGGCRRAARGSRTEAGRRAALVAGSGGKLWLHCNWLILSVRGSKACEMPPWAGVVRGQE